MCNRINTNTCAGEEGRVSDLQQHPSPADRNPQPHGGIFLLPSGSALHPAQRVRRSLPPIDFVINVDLRITINTTFILTTPSFFYL